MHYLAGNQRKECVGSGAADLVYPLYDHCQRRIDDAQEDYKTYVLERLFYLTIPNTCSDPERAALISEVITHKSPLSVIPLYYDTVVEQKGLRNEDSIEMLDIMRRTRSTDIASLFGWDTTLKNNINNKIFAGDTNIASEIEKIMPKVKPDTNAAEVLEYLRQN